MGKFMLIGGGCVGKSNTLCETLEIDKEVVKMSKKENPNFLFIGLASSFSDSYYDTMKKIYKSLGCECSYLKRKNIVNNPNIAKEKILAADIIYIGGGDTIKLMNDVRMYGILELIKEASDNGCVIAGISAGAIFISECGLSDSLILRGEGNDFSFIDGAGLLPITIIPHYHNDNKRKDFLMNHIPKQKVIGIDNCAALRVDGETFDVIKSKDDSMVCYCYMDGSKYIEEEV